MFPSREATPLIHGHVFIDEGWPTVSLIPSHGRVDLIQLLQLKFVRYL